MAPGRPLLLGYLCIPSRTPSPSKDNFAAFFLGTRDVPKVQVQQIQGIARSDDSLLSRKAHDVGLGGDQVTYANSPRTLLA